jgi:RNA polymerase sigma-70 factor, ECF subfamily
MDDDIRHLLSKGRREAAFEALVDRYQNKVFRLVFSMVYNAARSEEVTQDIFLKVWQALPGYDARASLSTWIYTIARNTTYSHLKSESYRKTAPLDGAPEPVAPARITLDRLEIERLLARLPEEQRQVVAVFYLQDRSIEDVAQMLDLPVGTVKSHLHRARRSMAGVMEGKQ